ncbi:PLP-dependent aminotransferase family protein, partial [Agromyces seonyuensis]
DERAWRAAWRAAAARPVTPGWGDRRGEPRLRAEIAEHLRVARGVDAHPDEIRVAAGTSEALAVLAQALGDLLGRSPAIAVEDPGYPTARRILARQGARLTPVAVDDDGFDADLLDGLPERPDAVLLTPSHHYPLGGRLPLPRRLALVDWAARTGGVLVEDDYDSEFRHTGAPLPALASLDRGAGRVVLLGSLSKVLTPSLRLGWLLVRDPVLRAAIDAVRADLDAPMSVVAQDAAARLLESGALRRHIAAVRREYAHRRGLVLDALGDLDLPGVRLRGLDGGLHGVLELPSAVVEDAVLDRLADAGVRVARLRDYRVETAAAGIIFGYAAPTDLRLAAALAEIARAVRASV